MKTFYVNRKTWGTSRLLDIDNGKMCCLGFLCRSFGLKSKDISGYGYPEQMKASLQNKLPVWLRYELGKSKELYHQIGRINDDEILTWEKKEELLKPLFAAQGIKIVFRGKR